MSHAGAPGAGDEPREGSAEPIQSTPTPSDPLRRLVPPSLILVESRREICMPAIPTVYLGRLDETANSHPHVDFTHEGGVARGVSRRHARIHLSESGTFIEDLDSTNGTYINGRRLLPRETYPLDHGDMIQLGSLKLAIIFPQPE